MDWLLRGVLSWLGQHVVGGFSLFLGDLRDTIFVSPDVTAFPQTAFVSSTSLWVVNVGYILAVLVGAMFLMTEGSVQIRYGVKDFAPRLITGLVLANFANSICSALIVFANALTKAFAVNSTGGLDVARFGAERARHAADDPSSALLILVVCLLILVLLFALLATWFVRMAILIILVGVAPLALACYCLPQTQPAAQLWWRSMLGCLGTQVLQTMCFSTGMHLLLTPQYNVPIQHGDTLNLFVVLVVLWLTVKVPSLVRRYVMRSGGPGVGSYVLRVLFVQRLAGVGRLVGRVAR